MIDRIMITGGAGYLARAIYASPQFAGAGFTAYSRDETKQDAIRQRWPDVRCILGDVRDEAALVLAMAGHDIVIHAAALKYVPEAEFNVREAIEVNVTGTRNVLTAARRAGVKRVVVISTDKAVSPLNTYGATKMLAERLVGEAARTSDTPLCTVARYGNVVGSTGSVIQKWRAAARAGHPVTLTDPMMSRFWMAPSEAVEVVHAALTIPTGGTLVSYCAAMQMGAVVSALGIPLDAITPSGLRPGEKMDEELIGEAEIARYDDPRIDGRWGGMAYLRPAWETPRRREGEAYRSSNPGHWLTAAEFMAAVEESEALL